MKARLNKEPQIAGYIELNQKYGHGFQGRLVLGIGGESTDSVLDNEPYELSDAYSGMYSALEDIKKRNGYKYKSHELIHITAEGIDANKKHDWTAATLAQDIKDGKGKLSVPFGTDYKTEIINGEEQALFSARGTLLMTFFMWRDDKTPKAKEALQRYCEYLAMHRYGKGANYIFAELESMDTDRAVSWLKATFGKYVTNQTDFISYLLPNLN